MLGHAQFLRNSPFEVAREVYAGADLKLTPHGSHGDAIACTAAAHFADDFALFHHSNRGDVTVTAHADTPGVWLSVPIQRAQGRMILRPMRSRLAAPGRHDPMHMRGGEERLGLSLAEHHLDAFAERTLGQSFQNATDLAPHTDMQHPSHRAAARLVMDIIGEGTRDPGCLMDASRVASYLEPVMLLLLTQFGADSMRDPAPHPRDVKRTIDYIEASLTQPMTLSELVAIANVPMRTLSQHFKAATGMSPMAYIATRRLDLARELLESQQVASVTEAALASGITHLGRFSVRYRARFGEAPSRTLGRARRVAGRPLRL